MPFIFDDIRNDIDVEKTRKNVELIFAKYIRMKIKIRESRKSIPGVNDFKNEELIQELDVAENFTRVIEMKVNSLSKKQREILELCYLKNEAYFLDSTNLKESYILRRLDLSHSMYFKLKREAVLHFAIIYDFSVGRNRARRLLEYQEKREYDKEPI